jgi:hypothetical protein
VRQLRDSVRRHTGAMAALVAGRKIRDGHAAGKMIDLIETR